MSDEEFEHQVVRPLFVTVALLKDYSVIKIQEELKNRELKQNATEIKEKQNDKRRH